MTLNTTVSSQEFEKRFSEKVAKKATEENSFYGKIEDGSFVLKNADRSDSVIKGTYSDDENGNCRIEYRHTKPNSDKVFWFIYMAITGFFTLSLLKDYPLYSLIAFILLVFGAVCFMIRPRRFEKLMAQALTDISNGETPVMPAPNKSDAKEDKTEEVSVEESKSEQETAKEEAEEIKTEAEEAKEEDEEAKKEIEEAKEEE